MTIEVIWGSGSPYAWRVLLTLEVKGLPYELRLIQFSRGDHRSPEHLALNPRGKVPVLRDGDFVLSESLAIMAYLDRNIPSRRSSAALQEETGLIWKAIFEFQSYVARSPNGIVVPAFGGRPLDAADMQAAAGGLHGELGRMEEAASARGWLRPGASQRRRPRGLSVRRGALARRRQGGCALHGLGLSARWPSATRRSRTGARASRPCRAMRGPIRRTGAKPPEEANGTLILPAHIGWRTVIMKAIWRGQVIAESDRTLEVDGYQYFPRETVRMDLLRATPKTKSDLACPHGVQFYDVADGTRAANGPRGPTKRHAPR